MKMKRLAAIIAVLLLVPMLLTACGSKNNGETTKPTTKPNATTTKGQEPYRMALVVKNLTNPYFVTLAEGAKRAAKELGIELDVQATNVDTEVEAQIQILDALLAQDLDAMLVIPLNNTAVVPWVKRANEAGVPIINIDTAIDEAEMQKQGASVISKLTTNNVAAGEEAARAIIKALNGSGKVAVLEGTAGATTAEDRKRGFNSVMESEGQGIEIVASQDGKYNRNEGYTITTSLLAAHPDLDAIFGANDEMALGAIAAIEEAGLTGQIQVVGVNFAAEIQDKMREGKCLGSVNQDPDWLGYKGVYVAFEHLEGETVEYTYTSPSKMMYKEDLK